MDIWIYGSIDGRTKRPRQDAKANAAHGQAVPKRNSP